MVVALALAAVFGSMSLANPALAAIGQPADGELTESTIAPLANGFDIEVGDIGSATSVNVMWTVPDADRGAQWRIWYRDPEVGGGFIESANLDASDVGVGDDDGDASASPRTSGTEDLATLSGDTAYEVRVEQRSADGSSRVALSEVITAMTNAVPNGAFDSTDPLTETGGPGQATLMWDYDEADTDAVAPTKWQYQMSTTSGTAGEWMDVPGSDAATRTYTVTGITATASEVTAGQAADPPTDGYPITRYFQVRPVNGNTFGASATEATVDDITTPPLPMLMLGDITATAGDGQVKLSWARVADAVSYSYTVKEGTQTVRTAVSVPRTVLSTVSTTVMDLNNGTEYTFEVTAVADATTHRNSGAMMAMATPMPTDIPVVNPSFTAGSTSSYSNTTYKVTFQTGESTLNTLGNELLIEFHEDYTLPSSISASAVIIDVDRTNPREDDGGKAELTFNPRDIVVDGETVVISVGDMNEDDDVTQYQILPMAVITVDFRQVAGIRNPTEAGNYNIVKIEFGDVEIEYDESNMDHEGLNLEDGVRRKISLSEGDGGLGDMVTATAKGFENGGTLHFFLDRDADGMLDPGEDVLCSVPSVSGENVGSCDFEVTTPTFSTGYNFINAVDGDGNPPYDPDNDDHRFELKASISASPAGGSPGEIMQVQLVSFPMDMAIEEIKLSGDYICGGVPPRMTETVSCSSYGTIGSLGTASIAIKVPNWAVAGNQELRIKAGGKTDTTNVTIVGPRIVSTPATVVANQRISLVGTGFSPNSVLGDDTVIGGAVSKISIGGHPIEWAKVNDGRDVRVDDGGNWSASVDLPLVEATTGSGDRTIRITDSKGRNGSANVSLAERSFEITPPKGRVGTLAVVRGVGYPSKNDEGHSFTIDVIYKVQEGATSRVSVVPDASGRFEVQLRIPTTAAIPSTNQVEVSFDHESGGTQVLENKQHMIPEGIISLSRTSGAAGTTVTVSGEGFKTFVPIESVKVGAIEVTPAPKPSTDANGMMEFDILIPGLDVGIQTIEVKVGGTTSSTGFTVVESGVAPGDIVATAKGLEPLGDNLESIWHFNNDTKVWSFYDGLEGSDLENLITGETYLIQVKATSEVILNHKTRNLTCNDAGNCWNQIVW